MAGHSTYKFLFRAFQAQNPGKYKLFPINNSRWQKSKMTKYFLFYIVEYTINFYFTQEEKRSCYFQSFAFSITYFHKQKLIIFVGQEHTSVISDIVYVILINILSYRWSISWHFFGTRILHTEQTLRWTDSPSLEEEDAFIFICCQRNIKSYRNFHCNVMRFVF